MRRVGTFAALAGIAVAGALASCIAHGATRAYPLYPSPRLRRDQVALLLGLIATVDGADVPAARTTFELLPRCHLVTTQTKLLVFDPITGSNGAPGEVVGSVPELTYAIDMKAGHTYAIERQVQRIGGNSASVEVTARDVSADGQSVDLSPVRAVAEIAACKGDHP